MYSEWTPAGIGSKASTKLSKKTCSSLYRKVCQATRNISGQINREIPFSKKSECTIRIQVTALFKLTAWKSLKCLKSGGLPVYEMKESCQLDIKTRGKKSAKSHIYWVMGNAVVTFLLHKTTNKFENILFSCSINKSFLRLVQCLKHN